MMTNRVSQVTVETVSLSPAHVELRIEAETEPLSPSAQIRGRLLGPKCPYASTIELSYPLRPLNTPNSFRVIIPEPSFWDPQSPFLYSAHVELWENGRRQDERRFVHGIRHVALSSRGLFVNGRRWRIDAVRAAALKADSATELRQRGFNTIVVPHDALESAIWDATDRLGFFVLGDLGDRANVEAAQLPRWEQRASCLGWLFDNAMALQRHMAAAQCLLGLGVETEPRSELPREAAFLMGDARQRATLQGTTLPWLLCCDDADGGSADEELLGILRR